MKILHYIPKTDTSNTSATEYVNCLVRSTALVAESVVLTQKDLGSDYFTVRRHLLHRLKDIKPDIVHVHASWNAYAAWVEHIARSHGYLTIVSVHGGFAPEIMELDFFKQKLPRIVAYQFQMVRNCQVVVAISDDDAKQIKQLGWKKRIVVIPHPNLHLVSDEETADLIMSIYRKVLDTNYMKRITDEETDFIRTCVKYASWPEGALEQPEISTEGLSFRRIFIYAHDNNVTEALMTGARRLGVKMPPCPDIEAMARFKVRMSRNADIDSLNRLASAISMVIPGAKIEVGRTPCGTTTLRTYTDIFQTLRFHDYDEDEFAELIKKKGVNKFTAHQLYKLQELFGMELGYMPILPKK